MTYYLDNNNIYINFDTTDKFCWKFYYSSGAYLYSNKKEIKIKLPIMLTTLKMFRDYFKLNDNYINNLISTIELNLSIKDIDIINDSVLRDYQNKGVSWLFFNLNLFKFSFLFWDMRTGKTITSLKLALMYKKSIVLCLSGQEDNWTKTLETLNYKGEILTPKKFKNNRQDMYNKFNNINEGILIVSMNSISKDLYDNEFLINSFDLLIIDEVHKVKNPKTSIYQNLKALVRNANYKLGITGTPVSKNESEVIPLFSLFNSSMSKTFLMNYFFEIEDYSFSNNWNAVPILREDKRNEWLEFINTYAYQIKKEEVLSWVIPPKEETIYLEFSKEQRQVYNECLIDFQLNRNINNEIEQLGEVIAQMIRLRQITIHPMLINNSCDSVKEQWILKYLQDNPNEKVIIFSTFTSYLEMLYDKLSLMYNYKCLKITGKVKNKTKISEEFNNTDTNILLANIQAGSKGLTLDSADTLIFLDKDWKPDENKQAQERLTATTKERVKQQKIFNLVVVNSIDEHIDNVLNTKISNTELINNYKKILLGEK